MSQNLSPIYPYNNWFRYESELSFHIKARKSVIWIIKLRTQAFAFSMQATKLLKGEEVEMRCPENKSARLITSQAETI